MSTMSSVFLLMQIFLIIQVSVPLKITYIHENYNLEDEAITHRAGFQHRPFPARVSSVFYDIDGTIKPSIERNIPRANSDAIEAMRGLGIKSYTATGRCMEQIEQIFGARLCSSFSGFITENGAIVFNSRKEIIYNALDDPESKDFVLVKKLLKSFLETKFTQLINRREAYFQNNTVNLTLKPKEGTPRDLSIMQVQKFTEATQLWVNGEGKKYSNSFEIFEHWDAMDIVPIGVSKAKGIYLLAQAQNINLNTSLYAGDASNDPFEEVSVKLGMFPVTYTNATKYAVDIVGKLDGTIFSNCSDYNLASCILDKTKYNRDSNKI